MVMVTEHRVFHGGNRKGQIVIRVSMSGRYPVLYRGGRGGHGHRTQGVRRGQQEGADSYQG